MQDIIGTPKLLIFHPSKVLLMDFVILFKIFSVHCVSFAVCTNSLPEKMVNPSRDGIKMGITGSMEQVDFK